MRTIDNESQFYQVGIGRSLICYKILIGNFSTSIEKKSENQLTKSNQKYAFEPDLF